MLHFEIKINIVLLYNKKRMQILQNNNKMLRGHSRSDIQIWICLVLQANYLFNVNFVKNDLHCIQWIYLVLQITTSQIYMLLHKYSVSIHSSM